LSRMLFVLTLAVGCGGTDDTDAHTDEPDACADLGAMAQAWVDQEQVARNLPGLALGIETAECGSIVVTSGNAVIDPAEPLTPDHAMGFGSVSKTFTGAAVMLLAEEGALSLDDPLSKYDAGWVWADQITVRHLLGHRSGLRDYFGWPGCYPDRMTVENTPEDLLGCVRAYPPSFTPGSEYAYSSTNYVLLGTIVEEVTGQPLHDAVRSRVLQPAGLQHSGWLTDDPPRWSARARSYFGEDDVTDEWSPTYAWGAGDVYGTPGDQLLWVRELIVGDLLSADSRAAMQEYQDPQGGPEKMGLGVIEREVFDGDVKIATLHGHNGRWDASTESWHIPEWDAAFVLMMNERVDTTGGDTIPQAWIQLPDFMTVDAVIALEPWFAARR
jgi:D-alanyl-D-alanine carboxypeptidase